VTDGAPGLWSRRRHPHHRAAAQHAGGLPLRVHDACPWLLYGLLPFPLDYEPFDTTHVLAQLQLLFLSAAPIIWLKLSGIYPPELRSTNLDADWIYRRLAPRAIRRVGPRIQGLDAALRAGTLRRWSGVGMPFRAITDPRAFSREPGRRAAWSSGSPCSSPPAWCSTTYNTGVA